MVMAALKQRLYLPTTYETVSFSIGGLVILSMGVFLSALKDYDLTNYNFLSVLIKHFVDTKLNFLDSHRTIVALTFLLWSICGILVYLAIWFSVAIIRSYRDDTMPIHGFLWPRNSNRSVEIFGSLARGLVRFIALVAGLFWIVFLLKSVFPGLNNLFSTAVAPFTYKSIPLMLASSILLGAGFYVLLVFLRLIFLRKRLFSDNITE